MDPIPFNQGYLPEQDGHNVFFAEYGKKDGPAIVVLHGGPGSKSKPKHVAKFDLKKYRVIAFDQRGCGKSLPLGSIEANTTQELVADMERLREELGLTRWVVAGASWGAALALAYAHAHTERVVGLLLGSVFLARKSDTLWAMQQAGGAERMFPDLWEARLAFLSKFGATPANAAEVLLRKLLEGDERTKQEVAAGVANWEGNLMSTISDVSFSSPESMDEEEIASAKIALHFEANDYFLTEDALLARSEKVATIPTVIVHGRYDVLCPPDSAWKLRNVFDSCEITFLPSSAHRLTAEGELALARVYDQALTRFCA